MCSPDLLETRPGRKRLLATALNLTANTALAPDDYEWQLLEDFVRGMMTIDEAVRIMAARIELTQQASELRLNNSPALRLSLTRTNARALLTASGSFFTI